MNFAFLFGIQSEINTVFNENKEKSGYCGNILQENQIQSYRKDYGVISWRIVTPLKDMALTKLENILNRSFVKWQKYSNLKFKMNKFNDSDISIHFIPIDSGLKNIGQSSPLFQIYDSNDDWITKAGENNLECVSLLLIGLSIGMKINLRPTSVMFPFFSMQGEDCKNFDMEDIYALKKLYT